jgi:hypothetical protein
VRSYYVGDWINYQRAVLARHGAPDRGDRQVMTRADARRYNVPMLKPGAEGAAQRLVAARRSLEHRLDFPAFLARLSPKDRLSAERRVQVLEAEPDPGRAMLWRRLVCTLMTLAPHAARFVGKQTVQFYVADGRYRKQVFAMEDLQDGHFTIYCPDVMEEFARTGLLARQAGGDANRYVMAPSGEPLRIEPLDGRSLNPGAHFKDLTGWNRKALRITLSPGPSPAQVEAVELLCAVAAQHFAAPPAPLPPPQ